MRFIRYNYWNEKRIIKYWNYSMGEKYMEIYGEMRNLNEMACDTSFGGIEIIFHWFLGALTQLSVVFVILNPIPWATSFTKEHLQVSYLVFYCRCIRWALKTRNPSFYIFENVIGPKLSTIQIRKTNSNIFQGLKIFNFFFHDQSDCLKFKILWNR